MRYSDLDAVLDWRCSGCLDDANANALGRKSPLSQTLRHLRSFRRVSHDLAVWNYKHTRNEEFSCHGLKSQGKQQTVEGDPQVPHILEL